MTMPRIHPLLSLRLLLLLAATTAFGAAQTAPVDPESRAPDLRIENAGKIRVVKREPAVPAKEAPSLPVPPLLRPSTNTRATLIEPPAPDLVAAKLPVGPVGWKAAPLGLSRLTPEDGSGVKKVPASKFEVVELTVPIRGTGIRKAEQGLAEYLEIDGGRSWVRKLRGPPESVIFVSFLLNASLDTEVQIGGARLRIQASRLPGYAEIAIGESEPNGDVIWKSISYHIRVGIFGENALSILPVFTVRLDSSSGVWDLFTGAHQVIGNQPVVDTNKAEARLFTIIAGSKGAWLCGAVIADENPLFDDANANGIRDEFELTRLGALQKPDATVASRQALAADWKMADPRSTPDVWNFPQPQPDFLVPAQIPTAAELQNGTR